MVKSLAAAVLLSLLAMFQQSGPVGRWVHNGPIGEVILELRADKGYELKFPGAADVAGTWEMQEGFIVLTPADNSKPRKIEIKSLGADQVNINFLNGMAMDFVRAGVEVVKEPEPQVEETVEKSAIVASRLYGEWYWESGDDDMTLEVYPDGTYYFDYWIGEDEYDSEGTFKLEGDSILLKPEEGRPITLTILEIQSKNADGIQLGDKILIRLAYGKEYWLECEDTFDPDDY